MIDPKQIHGSIQVELYICTSGSSLRPHFTLTQATDKHWYDFYVDDFEQTWKNAQRTNETLTEHMQLNENIKNVE